VLQAGWQVGAQLEVQQLLDFHPLNNEPQLDLHGSLQVVVQGVLQVLQDEPHELSQPLPSFHPPNNEPQLLLQPVSQLLPQPPNRLNNEPQPLSQPEPQPPLPQQHSGAT